MEHGEKFNTYSHLAGTAFALAGATVLIKLGVSSGNIWRIVSFSIYGITLVLMFASSTIYHGTRGKIKNFFRLLDHNAIYLLIAGTYTPFTLVTLQGSWGWPIFGVVWGLATVGMVQESRSQKKSRRLSLAIYILMGWIALIATAPLQRTLGWTGFSLLATGGAIYTLGIIFYLYDSKFRHWHGIWHLFVLAGSAVHYFTFLMYVA